MREQEALAEEDKLSGPLPLLGSSDEVTSADDNDNLNDDENDTLDECSKVNALQDESMLTAQMENSKSSRHADAAASLDNNNTTASDLDDLSFVSCDSGPNNKRINIFEDSSGGDLGDSSSDSHSNSNSNSYSANNSHSEYSESMRFSSIRGSVRRELEHGYKYSNLAAPSAVRPTATPEEGAPAAFGIPGPGEVWQRPRRISRSDRTGEGNTTATATSGNNSSSGNKKGFHSTTPPRTPPKKPPKQPPSPIKGFLRSLTPPRTPPRRRQTVSEMMDDLGYGAAGGSPKRRFSAVRGSPRTWAKRQSFKRSNTSEGIGARRSMLRRANTEKFHFKLDDAEDDEKSGGFKRIKRSRSMDLGGSFEDDHSDLRRNSYTRLGVSVAFGASREQSHYQPTVIRKSKKMDLLTGGEMYRDVLCQRIIDYPDAMDPAERRRKTVVRTRKDQTKVRSMHGTHDERQYRLQSRVHAQHTFHKEQMQTQTVQPGPLTRYLIWSLRSHFVLVLMSEACAFLTLTCTFAICIYLGATYQPQCLQLPDGKDFEESGSYFIDAYHLSWTTFSTVGYGIVHPQIRREEDQTSFNCAFMTTLTALEAFVGVLFASFCGAVIVGKMTRARSTASVRFSQRMILRFGMGVMGTDDDDDRCSDRLEKPVSEYDKRRLQYPCPVLEFRVANTLFGNVTGEIMNSKLSVVCGRLDDKKNENHASIRNSVMGIGGVVGATTRPGLDVLRGMTQSASKMLFRPFHDSSIGTAGGSDTTSVTSTNNLYLAAKKSVTRTDSHSESNNSYHSFNNSISSIRNVFRSHPSAPLRRASSPEGGKMKGKTSVLGKISKVGRDAIEGAVLKKRLMRASATMQESIRDPIQDSGHDTSDASVKKDRRNAICVEEDPTGGLKTRKLFSSLSIECSTHPFFKRVWTIRHVLKADSPLLSERARQIIKESRGRWPAQICNHNFIRKHVDFQQLIVSLSGTTTGNKVYGLHVYDFRNLHVGYTFSPILQYAPDGRLVVDIDGIDNMQEQRGGGAEAINYHEVSLQAESAETPDTSRPPLSPAEELEEESDPLALSNGPRRSDLNLTAHSIDEVDESIFSGYLRPMPIPSEGEEESSSQNAAKPAVSFKRSRRLSR